MKNTIYIDRSRLEKNRECERAGYWGYGYKGMGIQPVSLPLPMARGLSLHIGVGGLVEGMPPEIAIEGAVSHFRGLATRGLEIEEGEELPPSCDEQERIIEGALWAFFLTAFERIKAQYETVLVEKEVTTRLSKGVYLMTRHDALLRHKVDGTHHLWSLKTTGGWDKRKEKTGEHDVQGLSEALAVEREMGVRVDSIQMCYLVCGKRKKIKTGIGEEYITNSPFAWGHRRVGGGVGQPTEYACSSYYDCKLPHQMRNGKRCEGKKTHKIGDDFELFPTNEYPTGVQGWIQDIHEQRCLGSEGLLEELIKLPSLYYRQRVDLEDFSEQATAEAKEMRFRFRMIEKARALSSQHWRRALNRYAIQNKRSCDYPGACEFQALCFPPPMQREEVLGDSLRFGYKVREPNHPDELTKKGKGKNGKQKVSSF